ncbi:Oidioi.mRNA.OKI2018_I69.PAR.g9648.t1.cds [Oikopleura dioica]|uniref:Oidioi.mRNA.OKI2018_I69.PAR.g9648.t1.cds n=1 Tax=Oikopleura dioica TaxID=34765 RepID=A0ABN7RMG6_OIKDI|nr:Oidioi.mRNA.OKI2018_I69.PAR.g9648.t1.cds [Oikopleura dioica]
MKFDDNHYQQAKISVPFAWLCGFMLIIPIARNTVYENDTCGIDWNNKPETNMPSFIKADSGKNASLTDDPDDEAEDYGSEDPLDWMSSVVEDDDFLSKILKNDSELIELDQFHARFHDNSKIFWPHLGCPS